MDLIRGSLNNPIARFMSAIAIILLGLIAFSKLSVDLFPDITYPIVSVVTEYKGASPEDVEISISRPIEKIVSRIQNVKSVQSRSREGLSIIQVEFNWGTNLDTSATDIQNGVNQILSNLPKDADQPIIIKFDPSQISVITLALAGSMDEWKLRELAEDGIAPRIESLPGVAAANVFGGEIREIQVEAFRPRLEASGLALEHVIDAVKTSNVDLPGGSLKAGVRDYTVRTIGKPLEVSRLEDFVVTTRNGSAIRLRDIARVRDGFEEQETSIHVNASKGLIIGVQKQSGGNTVAVVDAVRNEIPRIRRDLPPGVSIEVVNDQSTFIRKSIKNLQHEAIIGAILATLIILLFLRNFTSTVIIAHSIPISIIATFVLLHFNKLSLNIMTLGGLALGVGRLVDDAIVVLENI
ncbi:MAG: efflux RND transporter permease subunit, partial [Deltaproteobacteria bacterium]|nr:efflux RND transporter permease subunit [Deltaproteobacteria bacterium]